MVDDVDGNYDDDEGGEEKDSFSNIKATTPRPRKWALNSGCDWYLQPAPTQPVVTLCNTNK